MKRTTSRTAATMPLSSWQKLGNTFKHNRWLPTVGTIGCTLHIIYHQLSSTCCTNKQLTFHHIFLKCRCVYLFKFVKGVTIFTFYLSQCNIIHQRTCTAITSYNHRQNTFINKEPPPLHLFVPSFFAYASTSQHFLSVLLRLLYQLNLLTTMKTLKMDFSCQSLTKFIVSSTTYNAPAMRYLLAKNMPLVLTHKYPPSSRILPLETNTH